MRVQLLLIAATTAVLSLSGCGEEGPGNAVAYQDSSRNCSTEFVSEYNRLSSALKETTSTQELDEFESTFDRFESKYRGVECYAIYRTSGDGDRTTMLIKADEKTAGIRTLLPSIRETLAKNTTARPTGETAQRIQTACSKSFGDDLRAAQLAINAAVIKARSAARVSDISVVESLTNDAATKTQTFEGIHGRTTCYTISHESYSKMDGAEMSTQLNEALVKMRDWVKTARSTN